MAPDAGKQNSKKSGIAVTPRPKCDSVATDSELFDELKSLLKRPDVDTDKVLDVAGKALAEAIQTQEAKIMSKRKAPRIASKLGKTISEKYQRVTVGTLKRLVRDKEIEYEYRDLQYARRDQLILALELNKWPSLEELKDAIMYAKEWDGIGEPQAKTPGQAGPAPRSSAVLINWSDLPILLKPQEVQQLLQISRTTFFRWVKTGELPGATRLGNLLRIDRNKLKAWVESQALRP